MLEKCRFLPEPSNAIWLICKKGLIEHDGNAKKGRCIKKFR